MRSRPSRPSSRATTTPWARSTAASASSAPSSSRRPRPSSPPPVSNEEFTKISAAKDYKPESTIVLGDKKFQIRDTISGQGEVEAFSITFKRISDAKAQLQQLVDIQPKLTNDDEKKQVEKAIKEIQDILAKSLEEFKKARGFDFTSDAITLPSEAKLSIQITEEEKKAIEAKAPAASDKK